MLDCVKQEAANGSVMFDRADIEVRASMENGTVTIDVLKSGACVHKLTIEDADRPIEHSWIADLFAREDRVKLSGMEHEIADYMSQLNINQG